MPNRDVVALRIVLEGSHGFPAIKDRHFKVHQNYVRTLGHGQLTALLAVLSREDLKIADSLKARLEHVEVMFDVKYFCHVAEILGCFVCFLRLRTFRSIGCGPLCAIALNRYAIASGPAWGMRHTFIPRGEIVGSGGSALS
jgi:hypothetical protein